MSSATKPESRYGEAVGQWERKVAIPMLALAGLSILILGAQMYLDTIERFRDSVLMRTLEFADLAILLVFAAEFGYRIHLVPRGRRISYVLANPVDVLIALVIAAQPLRLIRSARTLRALRTVRVGAMLSKGSQQGIKAVTRDRLIHGTTIVIIATTLGAYAFAFLEGDPSNNRFDDLADAFWWSASTITTLGPDVTFQSLGSRIVALTLTAIGLIIVAALAATIAAYFVETSPDETEPESPA